MIANFGLVIGSASGEAFDVGADVAAMQAQELRLVYGTGVVIAVGYEFDTQEVEAFRAAIRFGRPAGLRALDVVAVYVNGVKLVDGAGTYSA